jgi:Putative zinc-finger
MIDCCDFLDRYSDFRDRLLAPGESEAFESHLAGCESCKRYDRVVAGGIQALLRLPEVTPSPDFADRLGDRLSHLEGALDGGSSSGAPVALVIAVAATIAGAAWLPTLQGEPQPMRLPPTFAHAPYHPQLLPLVLQPGRLAVPAATYPQATYRAPGFAAYSLLGTPTTQLPARVAQAGR